EGGALARGVERRFAPGVEQIDALLALAALAQGLAVHVQAIGAAVDLRRAHLDQLDQLRAERGLVQVALDLAQGPHPGRGQLVSVQAVGAHSLLLPLLVPFSRRARSSDGSCTLRSSAGSARSSPGPG